jgi:hypothetical protein
VQLHTHQSEGNELSILEIYNLHKVFIPCLLPYHLLSYLHDRFVQLLQPRSANNNYEWYEETMFESSILHVEKHFNFVIFGSEKVITLQDMKFFSVVKDMKSFDHVLLDL